MKHRICLAWFGDLDAPDRARSKPKKVAGSSASQDATSGHLRRPKVKDVDELRRMFGRQ